MRILHACRLPDAKTPSAVAVPPQATDPTRAAAGPDPRGSVYLRAPWAGHPPHEVPAQWSTCHVCHALTPRLTAIYPDAHLTASTRSAAAAPVRCDQRRTIGVLTWLCEPLRRPARCLCAPPVTNVAPQRDAALVGGGGSPQAQSGEHGVRMHASKQTAPIQVTPCRTKGCGKPANCTHMGRVLAHPPAPDERSRWGGWNGRSPTRSHCARASAASPSSSPSFVLGSGQTSSRWGLTGCTREIVGHGS